MNGGEETEKLFLVDGNNLIHAFNDLKELPLDSALERVVEMAFAVSSAEEARVYIIMDTSSPNGESERCYSSNMKIVYAGKGRADECIEKLVHKLIEKFEIFVVSADYEIQKTVFSKGGFRLTPKEFRDKAQRYSEKFFKEKERFQKRVTVEDQLDEETRKKLEEMRRGNYNK